MERAPLPASGREARITNFDRTIEKSPGGIADPTRVTYADLATAYDFFNHCLFAGRLPHCLITMQRRWGAYGYFDGDRFGTPTDAEVTDEIALNPTHFRNRTIEDNLSTLVHEQVHLAQHHFGKPGERGYHNRQWARLMMAIGLIPSATGAPGGEQTGYRMSHYILPDGPFDRACRELLTRGFTIRYVERPVEPEGSEAEAKEKEARKRKASSKTKYTCPNGHETAWAKPAAWLVCGHCTARLSASADA
jgi:predicted SprT family Zn-dependent metalloprotease